MLLKSALETEVDFNITTKQYDLEEKFAALLIPTVLLIANLFTIQNTNGLGCFSWVCLSRGANPRLDFWIAFLNVLNCLKDRIISLKFCVCPSTWSPGGAGGSAWEQQQMMLTFTSRADQEIP